MLPLIVVTGLLSSLFSQIFIFWFWSSPAPTHFGDSKLKLRTNLNSIYNNGNESVFINEDFKDADFSQDRFRPKIESTVRTKSNQKLSYEKDSFKKGRVAAWSDALECTIDITDNASECTFPSGTMTIIWDSRFFNEYTCQYTSRYILLLDDDIYPFPGAKEGIIRVLNMLEAIYRDTHWLPVIIDAGIDTSVDSPSTSSLHRLPGDQTGELFVGVRLETRMESFLIDCNADRKDVAHMIKYRDEITYVWPPFGGYFPSDLWDNNSVSEIDSYDFNRSLQSLVVRGFFNHSRLMVEAWYNDADHQKKTDIGLLIWTLLKNVSENKVAKHAKEIMMFNLIPRIVPQSFEILKDPIDSGVVLDVPFFEGDEIGDGNDPFETYQTPGVGTKPTSYGVVAFGNSYERQTIQEYLWRKQNIKVNFTPGLEFDDADSLKKHFYGMSDDNVKQLELKWKQGLLIHSHAKAVMYACSHDIDAAVILEDDAYPLEGFQDNFERVLDTLQRNGTDNWGYHSLAVQYRNGPQTFINWYASDKEHSAEMAYDGIAPFRAEFGTWAQLINCSRWNFVIKKYFIDSDNHFISPWSQFEKIRGAVNNPSKILFCADSAYQHMFRRSSKHLNTLNFEPLVGLSLLEWAKPSLLHDVGECEGKCTDNMSSVNEARNYLMQNDFPLEQINQNRAYFDKHMWIPRTHICRRYIMDWARVIARATSELALDRKELTIRSFKVLGYVGSEEEPCWLPGIVPEELRNYRFDEVQQEIVDAGVSFQDIPMNDVNNEDEQDSMKEGVGV
eukprot:GHVH01008151.1.p1 GENE.GHVH01008151.1~~GHVH01008151.1.p1  ORF type:complete len:808 (+),score=112.81 GHVH01008151.1:72-2426(+)